MNSNAMLYAIPGILLLISLILCGFSAFNFKKESLSLTLAFRGGALTMIAILALALQNLVGVNALSGTTTFISIALVVQIFSEILSSLPTKSNIFAPIYSGLDMLSCAMFALAGLFIVPVSPFGLPIVLGVGIIASVITALAIRDFDWKTDIFKYASLSISVGILAQVVIIFMSTISVQTILFTIGSIIYVASVVIKLFFKDKNAPLSISRDVLYYISLLLMTASIFVLAF